MLKTILQNQLKIGPVGSDNTGRLLELSKRERLSGILWPPVKKEMLEQIKELGGAVPIKTGSNKNSTVRMQHLTP